MDEKTLREKIELKRQTAERLWKKQKKAFNEQKKMEAQLKTLESERLEAEKAQMIASGQVKKSRSEKYSGQKKASEEERKRIFEEAMAKAKKISKEES